MGVEGVIAPMINTVEDARALVATTKYPPVGERSWGPTRVLGLRGVDGPTYLASANKTALALAMIETERALGAVDAILAVEGLDGIFVGPSDLSLTLSGGRSVAPGDAALEAPLRRIAESAKRAGKIAGIFSPTAERARVFRDLGYPFVALGTDFAYLRSGAEAMLAAAGLRR
jgi:4-hydroxy-2-oxoheptanedioate aldolase